MLPKCIDAAVAIACKPIHTVITANLVHELIGLLVSSETGHVARKAPPARDNHGEDVIYLQLRKPKKANLAPMCFLRSMLVVRISVMTSPRAHLSLPKLVRLGALSVLLKASSNTVKRLSPRKKYTSFHRARIKAVVVEDANLQYRIL